ncbi:MAG: hypothetical protein ACFFCP_10025 [Promethearchaeota archaeon]
MRLYLVFIILILLFGALLVSPSISVEEQESAKKILIDYSHGQDDSVYGRERFDPQLFNNLSAMGYEVVIAYGGINSSILEDVDGFLLGSIRGNMDGFMPEEIAAIANWFGEGNRFLWVAYDSDFPYPGGPFINDNSTIVLEAVGSHVYGEPTHVWDLINNCGAEYRPYANVTSDNPLVADIVRGVDAVLMHGATCLYGSASDNASSMTNPVALENTTIANVIPLLYYSPTASIVDQDDIMPIAHCNLDNGSFVACTIEFNAGANESGIIIVSGSAPYGSYCPMYADQYYNWTLNGHLLILQAIDFAMNYEPPVPLELPIVVTGVFVGIIFVAIVVYDWKKKT